MKYAYKVLIRKNSEETNHMQDISLQADAVPLPSVP
jgi:hypothetical protein